MTIFVVDVDDRILFAKCVLSVIMAIYMQVLPFVIFEVGIKTGLQTANFKQVETEPLVYIIATLYNRCW